MTTQTVATGQPGGPAKLLTVNEVAAALGCGRTLVYELLGNRELAHIKIGRLTRIPPSEIDRFVARRIGDHERPSRRRRSAGAETLLLPGIT